MHNFALLYHVHSVIKAYNYSSISRLHSLYDDFFAKKMLSSEVMASFVLPLCPVLLQASRQNIVGSSIAFKNKNDCGRVWINFWADKRAFSGTDPGLTVGGC